MRGKKSTGKREQDTWKDVGHPKDTQGEAVRGGEEVNETEQGCQGDRKNRQRPPLAVSRSCLGSLLRPVTHEPCRPPFPMEQQRHLVEISDATTMTWQSRPRVVKQLKHLSKTC